MSKILKVAVFQDERYIGMIRIADRWHGLIAINDEELLDEIERRLPTLKRGKYNIRFE